MGQKIFSFNIGGKSCMGLNERIAELEAENAKLKQENDQLLFFNSLCSFWISLSNVRVRFN